VSLEKKLVTYAENNLNVMLIGSHGIGKTTVVKAVAEKLGLRFKYYSSSTLDPFAELIGIPVPDKDKQTVDFYRPKDLEEAEFVFFDELNRAHPRVLNTVLEIIQFKSINGMPLKNLKMVWAAINPPGGDYQVEELDPVLLDRFHMYIKMQPQIYIPYMKTKMATEIAVCLRDWWGDDLDDEQRRVLTPRRLEYIGSLIDKNLPFRDALPLGHTFPIPNLEKRVRIARGKESDLIIDKENILKKTDAFIKQVQEDRSLAIEISKCLAKFSEKEIFQVRDLLEELPKELVFKVGKEKFTMRKRNLWKMFRDEKLNFAKYPKIAETYDFQKWDNPEVDAAELPIK
jgi:hypothetical protein